MKLFRADGGTLDETSAKMKFKLYSPGLNPIYRDLVIVIVAGLLVSMTIVTIGFMILSQFQAKWAVS